TRPSLMPRSSRHLGKRVPSIITPPRMIVSNSAIVAPPWGMLPLWFDDVGQLSYQLILSLVLKRRSPCHPAVRYYFQYHFLYRILKLYCHCANTLLSPFNEPPAENA